jgi:tRNA(Ile)-lysidine synthase
MDKWKEIEHFLEPYRQHTIYLGCSGGVDSMVLLHLLVQQKMKIHVLHVNYHKRGKESDADMELVQSICNQYNILCSIEHFHKSPKGNFQANARQFRYDFFHQKSALDKGIIAMAHHQDDQIETFFMNLMRQSGVVGMASIPRTRDNIIRPLLTLSKNEILDYAYKYKIVWREDASNQSNEFLRNKWRLEYIPTMEQAVPNLRKEVATLINSFQQTQQVLEQQVQPIASEIFANRQLHLTKYNQLTGEELFELWRQLKQPSNLFHRFETLSKLSKGKSITATGVFSKIIREEDYLSFISHDENQQLPVLVTTPVTIIPAKFSKSEIYLNADKINGELIIRSWQKGDRISPIGVNGSQLVSQIIKDAKIPHHLRSSVLVVCDEKHIHWVVHLKVGKQAIAKASDNKIIHLKISSLIN